jgi:hypothetical protein
MLSVKGEFVAQLPRMDKVVLGQVTTLAGLTVAMTGWDGGDNRFIYWVAVIMVSAQFLGLIPFGIISCMAYAGRTSDAVLLNPLQRSVRRLGLIAGVQAEDSSILAVVQVLQEFFAGLEATSSDIAAALFLVAIAQRNIP